MKRLALTALLAAMTLPAADVSGRWCGLGSKPDNKYGSIVSPVALTLAQSGTNVRGSLTLNNHTIAIETGSVNGTIITLSFHWGKSLFTAQLTQQANNLFGKMTSAQGQVLSVALVKQ